MKFQPRRLIRYYYLKFLRLKGDPRNLARGIFVGTLTGLAPIMPFHTVSILVLAPILRGNIVAAFLATWICCNPVTYLPQYYFSWLFGTWLTPYSISWERINDVLNILLSDVGFKVKLLSFSEIGLDTTIVLLVGGLVFSLPLAIVSYFLSLNFFIRLRDKRMEKHILK